MTPTATSSTIAKHQLRGPKEYNVDSKFADDGPGHFENTELVRVLRGIKFDEDFDPYEVIHVPSEDRNDKTPGVSFRLPREMLNVIDQLHGNGKRFKNRSRFINHYLAVGLQVERNLAADDEFMHSLLDPAIARIELENQRIREAALDYIIKEADAKNYDGPRAKKEMLAQLVNMKRICEVRGYVKRLRTVINLIAEYDQP